VLSLPAIALAISALAFHFGQRSHLAVLEEHRTSDAAAAASSHLYLLWLDAEDGVRAYLLTGDDDYLAPYIHALQQLAAAQAELRSLLASRPDLLALLDRAEQVGLSRLATLERHLASVHFNGSIWWARPEDLDLLARGAAEMDEIRSLLTAVSRAISTEQKEIERRERAAQGTLAAVTAFTAALGLAGGLIVLLASTGRVTRRIDALVLKAEQLASGEQIGEADPGEDEVGRVSRAMARAEEMIRERDRKLRASNYLLEHLIASGPMVILRRDPATFLVHYVSPNVERIFGWRPGEIVGVEGFWAAHVHPDDLSRFHSEWHDALAEGRPGKTREYRFRHKNGEYRWLRTTARLEPGQDGKPPTVLAYFTDATERKAAEVELEGTRRAAEEANRAKNEFLSRMSHELRTPLNVILGFAQLLAMEDLPRSQRENVDDILKAGKHLLELIDEVLDISRIESGRLSLSLEPVDASLAIHEVIDLLRPLAADATVKLVAPAAPAGEMNVLADQQRLKQILINLISNAIKFNRPGGEVRVELLQAPGSRLRVGVTDTGPGIDPDRMHRLFTPFDRLGVNSSTTPGTGLGLALSQRLAEAMNGRLGVESEPGVGSTFWIDLPATESAAAVELAEPARSGLAPAAGAAVRRRVLYIEDNPANVKVVERILEHRPGVELLTALQGGIGLELARSQRPAAILLDLNLGDIDGQAILHSLKADPDTAGIPVIVVSADATPGQIQRLLDDGAFDYATKPIQVTKFLAALDRALATGEGET
jgi:PAS domain S-box-containing protein